MRTDWMERWRHRRLRARLDAYHSGELAGAPREAMRRHLAQCPDCAATLERRTETEQALKAARPDPPALPMQETDRLFRQALEAAQIRPRRTARSAVMALSLSAVGLGIVVWALLPRPAVQAPGSGAPMPVAQKPDSSQKVSEKSAPPRLAQKGSSSKAPLSERRPSPVAAVRRAGPATPALLLPKHDAPNRVALLTTRREAGGVSSREQVARIAQALEERGPTLAFQEAAPSTLGSTPAEPGSASEAKSESVRRPTQGHLVVVVTGTAAPRLNVTVETGPQPQPGYARVASYAADRQGNRSWTQCTIRDDRNEETTTTTEYALVLGRPVTRMVTETRETGVKEKGN